MLTTIYILIAALLVAIDQVTKWWATSFLQNTAGIDVIPGVFRFQYCENDGIAFSLLEGQRWLFIPLTLFVSVICILVLLRSPLRRRWLFALPLAMVLSGGVGNLIDRIRYGYVVDFLYFNLIDFPIFNFADCCVVVGAILLFSFLLFGLKGEEETPLRTLFLGIPVAKKENPDG